MRIGVGLAALGLVTSVTATDILASSGFQNCGNGTQDVSVSHFQLSFDRSTKELVFAVAGTSRVSQEVTAYVSVSALGEVRYTNSFNPCQYHIAQLCPIPAGPFHASGNITIPDSYVDQIPSIAFTLPDLDGSAKLTLVGNNNETVSCLTSEIDNGKSASSKPVTLATVGVAGAALVMTGVASLGSLGAAGAGTAGPNSGSANAPNFADVLQWFQFIAISGMFNVNYPPIYRSFSQNFGWSTGLVSWASMQISIDNFRAKTGGNLTDMNYQYLANATLVFKVQKRDLDFGFGNSGLVNSTASGGGSSQVVSGIAAFAEKLLIPSANTFMTVLLIFLIVLAGVAVVMLLFKVILELWGLCGHLSKRFEEIRQDYWRILFTTIVRIVLIVYGTWALYCLWQFRGGDSWAASLLAGVTLALFTALLAFFTIRIFSLAGKARKSGGVDELYEHKPWMRKYGFFYDQFKSRLWWFFVPIIIMSLVRAFLIVFGGSGMVQAIGILTAEGIFLFLLFWRRPYDGRGANVVNAMIAVVRVLSIVCILVFVQELGISRTTQTVLGVVLIALQSTLTIVLAVLIIISGITSCLHKRKPSQKAYIRANDDDLHPLGIPSGENVSELERYPTKGEYTATATSDPEFTHRASTLHRDPFMGRSPTPVYQEYSSSYGSSMAPSVVSRKVSLGHGARGSIGHESAFHYAPVGSPPPALGERTG